MIRFYYIKEYLPDRSKNVTFKILYVDNNTKTGFMNFVVIVLFTGTYCTLPILNKPLLIESRYLLSLKHYPFVSNSLNQNDDAFSKTKQMLCGTQSI